MPSLGHPDSNSITGNAAAVPRDSGHKDRQSDPAEVLPWLPCLVSLEIPLQHFTIGDLSQLTRGTVVATARQQNSELPLFVNGQLIGWTELEVIDERLAVRVTEVA